MAAPKCVPGGWLYSEFGLRYEQNHPRNKLSGHQNISIGTLSEILCAIVSVLCSYTSEIHESGEVLIAPEWVPRSYTVGLS